MRTGLQIVAALFVLALPAVGRAQVEFNDTQQLLTIHGTVTADEKAAEKIGYTGISIGFAGAPPESMRWIGVVRAETGDGDAFQGKTILDAIDGYTPNLLASGRTNALAPLRNAAAGSRVVVSGIVDPSARTFLVASVKVLPAGR